MQNQTSRLLHNKVRPGLWCEESVDLFGRSVCNIHKHSYARKIDTQLTADVRQAGHSSGGAVWVSQPIEVVHDSSRVGEGDDAESDAGRTDRKLPHDVREERLQQSPVASRQRRRLDGEHQVDLRSRTCCKPIQMWSKMYTDTE